MTQLRRFLSAVPACSIMLAALYALPARSEALPSYDLERMARSHDLSAPAWGPYSKRYAGISHIADERTGARFDVSVATGFFKGKIVVPNVRYLSDYHHWDASADLAYFSFREQLAWKDQVYADVAFAPLGARSRIMKIELVNNTDALQGLAINLMANLQYDEKPAQVSLPPGRHWTSGADYLRLTYLRARPDDSLRTDARRKGEQRSAQFTNGSGLGDGFGKDAGDRVTYRLKTAALRDGVLLLRTLVPVGSHATLRVNGIASGSIGLTGTGQFVEQTIALGPVGAGPVVLELIADSTVPIQIDGMTTLERDEVAQVSFSLLPLMLTPAMNDKVVKRSLILKYPGLPQHYGISWDSAVTASVREVLTDDYDNAIKGSTDFIYPHNYAVRDQAHTSNIYLRSFNLPAKTRKVIYALLSEGSEQAVVAELRAFQKGHQGAMAFSRYQGAADRFQDVNPAGRQFLFSQQRLKASMLQNVIYPIYVERQLVKQFVPGKRWNSLYTWDNGFIGLGMLEVDIQRAIESLNGYTNPPTAENAYIHHGSPVPVQFMLFQDIWNRTQSKPLLAYFYARLRNYYLFYTGQHGSSTFGKLNSDLINTFDYFYNSGGWDDYPAQEEARHTKRYGSVAPVINTALAIRIAKIMQQAATILAIDADQAGYERDIARYTAALQRHSWDQAAAYFSYVTHDPASGQANGMLRDRNGVNFNMGVDGVYPLVAGAVTPAQKARLMEHLFSPRRLWTPLGITTVDQSAPYYSENGYWNGTVWFPHQFILWKTMLDLGEGQRAAQIATTALGLYQKEVAETYNTTDLFRLLTGRSFGWHQFSGLSAPILNWFSAYYRPGTINVGFDAWIMERGFNADKTSLSATIHFSGKEATPGVLICMDAGNKYRVTLNGKVVSAAEITPGSLFITARGPGQATLRVTAIGVRTP